MLFKDIIGQKELISRLIRTVDDGRVSHSQLFLGSDGSGAFPLALAYGQYLNCENRQETDSCGTCTSCRQFHSFQHPDLYFSFPFFNKENKSTSDIFSNEWRSFLKQSTYFNLQDWRNHLDSGTKQLFISVYEANSLMKKVSLKSFSGGYKVVVMWHPEFMKPEAANKMLKVIEEPPEKTIFIMVTGSTEMMLATILSRTQNVKIPALNSEDIRSALITRNGIVSGDVVDQVVQFAQGDYCKALKILNQPGVDTMLENFRNWMRMCFKNDVTQIRKWADKMHESGREDVKEFVEYSIHLVRQCLLENYTGGQLSRLSSEEQSFANDFSKYINDKNIMSITEELELAHRDVTRNGYMKLVLFDLSLSLHRSLKL